MEVIYRENDQPTKKLTVRDTVLAYAGLVRDGQDYLAVLIDDKKRLLEEKRIPVDKPAGIPLRVGRAFTECARRLNVKIVSCGIVSVDGIKDETLGSSLWTTYDIVPHYLVNERPGNSVSQRAKQAARSVATLYWDKQIARVQFGDHREVLPATLTGLDAYRKHPTGLHFAHLLSLSQEFRQRRLKMIFLSSTPNGGGVALMRHALIRLARLLGLDIHWHVLTPNDQVFAVTKNKFHNILQGVAGRTAPLNERERRIYLAWIAKNAELLEPAYRDADVVVIDDPQPSGLIPYIEKVNPKAHLIYRSHIQIRSDLLSKRTKPQSITWSFLKKNILRADLFVSHPVKAFLPADIPRDKVLFMPATTDPLDGLNKSLSPRQIRFYQQVFNWLLERNGQKPLSLSRPYIIQVARFDPSKGIPDVVEAYRRFRKKLADLKRPMREIPQLVIMGNGAIDDPEGKLILDETHFLLEMDRYQSIAHDVKVLQVPHIDQLLNALLRGSAIALQLSHREGFEVKVSEAISKGIPVIAYRTGGIPLQIRSKENGFLVRTGDTKQVADLLYRFFTEPTFAAKLKKGALATPQSEFWTVDSLVRWLTLAIELGSGRGVVGNTRRVEDLFKKKKSL